MQKQLSSYSELKKMKFRFVYLNLLVPSYSPVKFLELPYSFNVALEFRTKRLSAA